MGELELVGLHEDGEHLVLAAPDGQRYRLRIDEPLRAAVRRDRPQLEQLRAERAGTLSPREVQARIRAGATAQEVADASGVPVESVRRYEGPVLAEREWVAEQARATRVGRDAGAPVLGDLVTDRLAARGVDPTSLAWDAAREGTGPWTVVARFVVADTPREARWTYDPVGRAVVAVEDEARWLSETELDEPVSRRHLAAVRDVVFDIDAMSAAAEAPPAPEQPEPTHVLLDELRSRRGVRQPLDEVEDDEEFEGFGPQHAFDFSSVGVDDASVPGAHPLDADPEREAVVLPPPHADLPAEPAEPVPPVRAVPAPSERTAQPERTRQPERTTRPRPTQAEQAAPPQTGSTPASPAQPAARTGAEPASGTEPADRPAPERRARRTRAKVPSWDEIVFGAKPE